MADPVMMVPVKTYEEWMEARAEVRAAVRSGMTITAITEAALGPCPTPKMPQAWVGESLRIKGDITGSVSMSAKQTHWTLSPSSAESIATALLTHAKYARRKGV